VIDVAARAGVSAMTVSRALNGVDGVREETRAAVLRAAEELSYTPNVAARSLVTSREVRIGVIYSTPSAAFISDFLTGVFEEAATRGAQLMLLRGKGGKPPLPKAVEAMIGAGVRGVILAPPVGESAVVKRLLDEARVPCAVVCGRVDGAISVRIDDRQAAYDMTRHLLELGHRRISFIIGNPDQSSSAERLSGFHAAIREENATSTHVTQGDFSYASGLVAGERLLDLPEPPTAIFASNDDMAAAVVSVAHRRHLEVPGDLTVVGFDDSTAATTLWPPLTTIRQPVQGLAAEAFHRLVSAIQDGGPAATDATSECILAHSLVKRQSTARPPRAEMLPP
jgi:LacI family transcriptional regulator